MAKGRGLINLAVLPNNSGRVELYPGGRVSVRARSGQFTSAAGLIDSGSSVAEAVEQVVRTWKTSGRNKIDRVIAGRGGSITIAGADAAMLMIERAGIAQMRIKDLTQNPSVQKVLTNTYRRYAEMIRQIANTVLDEMIYNSEQRQARMDRYAVSKAYLHRSKMSNYQKRGTELHGSVELNGQLEGFSSTTRSGREQVLDRLRSRSGRLRTYNIGTFTGEEMASRWPGMAGISESRNKSLFPGFFNVRGRVSGSGQDRPSIWSQMSPLRRRQLFRGLSPSRGLGALSALLGSVTGETLGSHESALGEARHQSRYPPYVRTNRLKKSVLQGIMATGQGIVIGMDESVFDGNPYWHFVNAGHKIVWVHPQTGKRYEFGTFPARPFREEIARRVREQVLPKLQQELSAGAKSIGDVVVHFIIGGASNQAFAASLEGRRAKQKAEEVADMYRADYGSQQYGPGNVGSSTYDESGND